MDWQEEHETRLQEMRELRAENGKLREILVKVTGLSKVHLEIVSDLQAENARLRAALAAMQLKQVEAEMRAGLGSSYGETREQVRRAIRNAEANSHD
jgi:hypothetical protein